jgi:hypothetical protein
VPSSLVQVIVDCLAKDPAGRPQTARELQRRLEGCADVDRWDSDRARAWWDEHGAALEGGSQEALAPTELADTIAVDLASSRR